MRIIFVRHAEPDYANDTLTEKGWREAALLAERVSGWDVTDFYVSPLGRARDTASLSLKKMGRTAETFDWLREFHGPVNDPTRGENVIPWDFYPEYWTKIPEMYDKDGFGNTEVMKSGRVMEEYVRISGELDALLTKYGYVREGGLYRTGKTEGAAHDATIVLFCHMGVTLFLCSIFWAFPRWCSPAASSWRLPQSRCLLPRNAVPERHISAVRRRGIPAI